MAVSTATSARGTATSEKAKAASRSEEPVTMQLTVLQPQVHEARWWETMADGRLHCYLCPRHCHIGEGQSGFCFIRKNEGGRLLQLGYGRPAAIEMDPVEKKPLSHFFPGTKILSMGTAGCNMGCSFCQNWDISKAKSDQVNALTLSAENVVEMALEHRAPHIAFTSSEEHTSELQSLRHLV